MLFPTEQEFAVLFQHGERRITEGGGYVCLLRNKRNVISVVVPKKIECSFSSCVKPLIFSGGWVS